MDSDDVKHVVQAVDEALRVFRQYEGRLTASEIRVRSMLSVVRSELASSHPERRMTDERTLFVEPPASPQQH